MALTSQQLKGQKKLHFSVYKTALILFLASFEVQGIYRAPKESEEAPKSSFLRSQYPSKESFDEIKAFQNKFKVLRPSNVKAVKAKLNRLREAAAIVEILRDKRNVLYDDHQKIRKKLQDQKKQFQDKTLTNATALQDDLDEFKKNYEELEKIRKKLEGIKKNAEQDLQIDLNLLQGQQQWEFIILTAEVKKVKEAVDEKVDEIAVKKVDEADEKVDKLKPKVDVDELVDKLPVKELKPLVDAALENYRNAAAAVQKLREERGVHYEEHQRIRGDLQDEQEQLQDAAVQLEEAQLAKVQNLLNKFNANHLQLEQIRKKLEEIKKKAEEDWKLIYLALDKNDENIDWWQFWEFRILTAEIEQDL